MTQTLLIVIAFVAALAALPWFVRRLQQQRLLGGAAGAGAARVVSALAVGPQQRVVTVEVGPAHARAWLVLGVTPQTVQCLHTVPLSPGAAPAAPPPQAPFAGELARVQQAEQP
ncbi:FliO/MopB family protein [Xylophilus sp.]|uniref:FliO/MopB family protein n=1 Tax=Xylophilus sp. TaxID=2653893 RepID=UPI0013BE6067|nr:flagellar biosynthetic protein FliO [Xylophilus sp.]KAF1047642.1 MAG: Flagellar protein FliO [Xylophilus sp.]